MCGVNYSDQIDFIQSHWFAFWAAGKVCIQTSAFQFNSSVYGTINNQKIVKSIRIFDSSNLKTYTSRHSFHSTFTI